MVSPTEINRLVGAMASDDPATAKGARLEIESLVHASATPGNRDRMVVADTLLAALKTKRSRVDRAHLLRLIGFVGDRKQERALAPFEGDRETGEDARMARERIRRGP